MRLPLFAALDHLFPFAPPSQAGRDGMDFLECKMRCNAEDGGLLWPLPSGSFQLSQG